MDVGERHRILRRAGPLYAGFGTFLELLGSLSGCGDTQHPIPAKWRPKRERRPFRIAFAGIARIVGCGGPQHPILAIGRAVNSQARCLMGLQATSP
jgi:hypothetical protein